MLTAARPRPQRQAAAGFTLIELMVTLTVLGLLMALSMPSFAVWLRNARVRTVTQVLQDGIRMAQTESLRRNRTVVFALTNGQPGPSSTASAIANGSNWMLYTVPLLGFESREYIRGGSVTDQAGGVGITGPAAICFNSAGRLSAPASTGVTGATCTVSAASPPAYTASAAGGDRPLKVTVSLGGQIRSCDPARTLSATAADGC